MDDQVLDLPRGTNLAQAGISAIDYLPEALQKSRLSKTYAKHYAEVVRNIAYVLRRPGSACIPKPAAVEATSQRRAEHATAVLFADIAECDRVGR